MAEEMGARLGSREILFGPVSGREKKAPLAAGGVIPFNFVSAPLDLLGGWGYRTDDLRV
jgi:hypothetical protein